MESKNLEQRILIFFGSIKMVRLISDGNNKFKCNFHNHFKEAKLDILEETARFSLTRVKGVSGEGARASHLVDRASSQRGTGQRINVIFVYFTQTI